MKNIIIESLIIGFTSVFYNLILVYILSSKCSKLKYLLKKLNRFFIIETTIFMITIILYIITNYDYLLIK